VGQQVDSSFDRILSATQQGGKAVVDNQKAKIQELPQAAPKMLTTLDKPVRGIDWSSIFSREPELEAPGYQQVSRAMQRARLEALTKE